MIPPLPKNYDVENRGHYNAGPPASIEETKETESQAFNHRNLWERC